MLNFFLETVRLGLKNLRLHKLRSLLTALGIIFGVAAVIIMVAIGEGAKQAALRQMERLGATNIVVRSVRPPEGDAASSRTQRTLTYGLTRLDHARMEAVLGDRVAAIVPLRDTEQKVIVGDVRANAAAIGTTPRVFDVINLRLSRGTLFTQVHYDEAAAVCVIGAGVAAQLFPFQDPVGQQLKIGTSGMSTIVPTIIGVLEPTGLRSGADQQNIIDRDLDNDVYFPLTLARTAFGDTNIKRQAGGMERKQIEVTEVWLQARSMADVEPLAATVEHVVEQNHPGPRDFAVKAPIQLLRKAEDDNRLFNFILVGIASFALVVGGIGIMNIMLASVTERTKEIGIRRALGAKRRHITLQFLVETTVISITGGLAGIAIGVGAARALPVVVRAFTPRDYPTDVATWSVVGSFVVSGLIGIGFGLYPAVTAARMNPIEALRHE